MTYVFDLYVEELRCSGICTVDETADADRAADETDMRGFDLILIQFAYLPSPKYHERAELGGATTGGVIANVLRKRGVEQPILLLNIGLESLAQHHHAPWEKTLIIHLAKCLPYELASQVRLVCGA